MVQRVAAAAETAETMKLFTGEEVEEPKDVAHYESGYRSSSFCPRRAGHAFVGPSMKSRSLAV